jgi:hypothetical protein
MVKRNDSKNEVTVTLETITHKLKCQEFHTERQGMAKRMPVKTKWQQPLKRNAPKMKCQKLQVYTSNHLKLQILNMNHTIATETTICTLAIKLQSTKTQMPLTYLCPYRLPQMIPAPVAPAPACRPQRAHRYLPAKRRGYSSSPSAPRAAKGPHTTRKS